MNTHTVSRWAWKLFFVLVSLLIQQASGQVLITSGLDDSQTHAWGVYRNSQGEVLVVHLPPRDGGVSDSSGLESVKPGELHAVRPLSNFPDGIAAIGERVYLVFPEAKLEERTIRRVYSGRAVPSPMGSAWGFVPTGRLDSEAVIPHGGELIDFVATGSGLWVLLKDDGAFVLMKFGEDGWEAVGLPVVEDQANLRWRLRASGEALIVIEESDGGLKSHVLDDELVWSTPWPTAEVWDGATTVVSAGRGLILIDGEEGEEGARIRVWSADGVFTIATGVELPEGIEFASLGSVNRLVGLAKPTLEVSDPLDDGDDEGVSGIQVVEIDLADGSVIYVGAPVVSTPVSEAEARFLMGMMVLIMVGVLVVVILPDKAGAMSIPDGFALADPGRRLMATMFDVFMISFAVGLIFDVRVIEIVTLSVIARSDTSWLVIPLVLVSGITIMSVMEWLVGATPGKLFMRVRLVRGQAGAMQRVSLRAAIVRNVIKWLLPPVAGLALLDPETLHRGDRITKTLVVTPIEGYEGSESGSESPKDSDPEA